MHITINGDVSSYDGVAVQAWGGINTPDQVAINTLSSGWGDDNTTGVTVLSVADNQADMVYTVEGSFESWVGMQLVCYKSDSIDQYGGNYSDINAAESVSECSCR